MYSSLYSSNAQLCASSFIDFELFLIKKKCNLFMCANHLQGYLIHCCTIHNKDPCVKLFLAKIICIGIAPSACRLHNNMHVQYPGETCWFYGRLKC